ncbi:brefeldin A-inhibited guanine nucleotide-exchange protein 2-like [Clarias magur]|uniref:Brefeldin A-inhibited guanine nucleotide-exchange protein 2-like n=1 Tax=Clarias magur TaxID=1594786 RepID=A0A8J4X5Z3_CLAMG|nr:brefeldin A-inhibited guanine nucleotide-exchange protein 2-like [Clarias magur]
MMQFDLIPELRAVLRHFFLRIGSVFHIAAPDMILLKRERHCEPAELFLFAAVQHCSSVKSYRLFQNGAR